jgi:Mg-chelatase subunit ChlD
VIALLLGLMIPAGIRTAGDASKAAPAGDVAYFDYLSRSEQELRQYDLAENATVRSAGESAASVRPALGLSDQDGFGLASAPQTSESLAVVEAEPERLREEQRPLNRERFRQDAPESLPSTTIVAGGAGVASERGRTLEENRDEDRSVVFSLPSAETLEREKAQAKVKVEAGVPLVAEKRMQAITELSSGATIAAAPADAPVAGRRGLVEGEIAATSAPEMGETPPLPQIELKNNVRTKDQVIRRELATGPGLQQDHDVAKGTGVEDKIPILKDIPILGNLFSGQAGAVTTPVASAAKPLMVTAAPVSDPAPAGEPMLEEQLQKQHGGTVALGGGVVEFDGFIDLERKKEAASKAPAADGNLNFTGDVTVKADAKGLADLDIRLSGGTELKTGGRDQGSAVNSTAEADGSVRFGNGLSSEGKMKDVSRLERLSEVDKSVQDILALTPQAGQAQGIDFGDIQAITSSGGVVRSSSGASVPESVLSSTLDVSGDDFLLRNVPTAEGFANRPDEANAHSLFARDSAALDETSPVAEPFSTFSLHVSDVSFQLAKAALASGKWPEADKIRIEEFVNAFDYGDPMPGMGERVACRIDQAAHPFLQQRNLVRIALRTAEAGRSAGTPLRLTLLLDSSGSMERPDRRETVRRAVATLAGLLGENDRITLVSFARQPRLVADAVPGNEAMQLAETVAALPSEGGTNLEAALHLAFEKAREHQEAHAQNRIVLLTDGAANLGDAKAESLAAQVETMREAGIAFDAAGFGAEGLNDEILEALTRKGDGRYYLLDRPEDAEDAFAKQIAGALRPAAKNVKVQVEFHPDRVKSYKLLGFEKHRLATEDFRNDAVDAAEMAAAEAGVAVYQVEPDPAGEGDLGAVSVRFRDLDSGEMIERRWALPHLVTAPAADQGGDAIRIATVASQFAAKLAGGPVGDVVDLAELARLAAALPESERVKELRTMIEQARGLEESRQ